MNRKGLQLLILTVITALIFAGCGKSDQTAAMENTNAPEFVNSRCPIMNAPIGENVPDNLVREFKSQKVAFCCGGCPAAWDKLTDEQKAEKLAASK